jgi:8-oxo-dGTP pyrophosphatase MutT (NUDIX family)
MLSSFYPTSPQVFRPSQLRKMKRREQVAAVCFRIGKKGIEFLLVRTDRGRWTFPKGAAEPGLSHAQSAALEAFEEAGVHGRMEEASFAQYLHRQRGGKRSVAAGVDVHAHLCEVLRLSPPKESHRKPAWLAPEKTKRRLQRDRTRQCAAELIRVVDLAVARIRSMGDGTLCNDALLERFESFDDPRSEAAKTITIEPRPWSVLARVAPGALSPRWTGLSQERVSRPLLQAASPGLVSVRRALVPMPRLTSRNGED